MSGKHSVPVQAAAPQDMHFEYTVLKGYFKQSEDSTDDTRFDFKKSHFGLIDRAYDTDAQGPNDSQWARFTTHIRHLVGQDASVKVLFLGRHGQGWHNVAESKYGTQAWDCYYSTLDGYDGLTWADAHLTPTGRQQALDVQALWKQQIGLGMPPPETFYVSPLTRAVQTADLSFDAWHRAYQPYLQEGCREALGIHTCDRRSTRSQIQTAFPHVVFEPGFVEEDALWERDYREPQSARRYRLAMWLDGVWATDDNVFVSLTSHSGAIASILEVLGHRRFALETGGVIPVVVRADKVQGKREVPAKEPSDSPPICDKPPPDVS
ncbi:putative phosphoglycerate mutase pmu1 [Pleosporales sp. CAS-2024a]